jgi:hypothetical protein
VGTRASASFWRQASMANRDETHLLTHHGVDGILVPLSIGRDPSAGSVWAGREYEADGGARHRVFLQLATFEKPGVWMTSSSPSVRAGEPDLGKLVDNRARLDLASQGR